MLGVHTDLTLIVEAAQLSNSRAVYVQHFIMLSSFCFTEICATFCGTNIREDISPILNINTFIFSKGVLALINKYYMNV